MQYTDQMRVLFAPKIESPTSQCFSAKSKLVQPGQWFLKSRMQMRGQFLERTNLYPAHPDPPMHQLPRHRPQDKEQNRSAESQQCDESICHIAFGDLIPIGPGGEAPLRSLP